MLEPLACFKFNKIYLFTLHTYDMNLTTLTIKLKLSQCLTELILAICACMAVGIYFQFFVELSFRTWVSLLKGRPAQTILSYKYKLAWGPTNRPREFHVETTWKRAFPRRFNVESRWCVCSGCSDGVGKHAITNSWTVICQTSRTFFYPRLSQSASVIYQNAFIVCRVFSWGICYKK